MMVHEMTILLVVMDQGFTSYRNHSIVCHKAIGLVYNWIIHASHNALLLLPQTQHHLESRTEHEESWWEARTLFPWIILHGIFLNDRQNFQPFFDRWHAAWTGVCRPEKYFAPQEQKAHEKWHKNELSDSGKLIYWWQWQPIDGQNILSVFCLCLNAIAVQWTLTR